MGALGEGGENQLSLLLLARASGFGSGQQVIIFAHYSRPLRDHVWAVRASALPSLARPSSIAAFTSPFCFPVGFPAEGL